MTVLKRILVATDFSAAARQAVWRAGQLAKQHDAHLHLVHAQPDWNLFARASSSGAEHYRAVVEHAEQALQDEITYIEATFGIHARGENRMGRASQVILAVVAEVEPHLLVVGARGEHNSPAMAPFLGGTALKLIAYAGSPVLVVRKPSAAPYAVAVAAVECSSAAARALVQWAMALLGPGDCHIVHAFEVPYVERMRKRGVSETAIRLCTEEVRNAAKSVIDEILDDEPGPGQRLHAHLVCGEPVGAVLAEIARCQPDLVVVGKHEHPPREQHLSALGSVALRIAYHAPVDVLVVP